MTPRAMEADMPQLAHPKVDVRRTLGIYAAGLFVILAAMLGIGWLVTHPLAHDWAFTAEDGVDRTLAAHRTRLLNGLSDFWSTLAGTFYAVLLTAFAAVTAALVSRGWREPAFIVTAIAGETAVFLVTTAGIGRPRPAVTPLDPSPPTSSFPSGHTAAALALYGAIIIVARRHGAPWPVWLLLTVPVAVGGARLYRGMHHPSDVVAGLVLGAACLALSYLVLLDRRR